MVIKDHHLRHPDERTADVGIALSHRLHKALARSFLSPVKPFQRPL